ncbi:MAG: carotenoid oxygenase family protein [Halobacteriales archaeon]|nr:carotenoid oxygenase family protein [Halobacteriales archaeon]
MVAHDAGFSSIDREYAGVELAVEGELPGWLEGTLLRNGPGRFETGDESVDHWFDGLSLLRAFRFADGGVEFSARFLESEAYRRAMDTGRLPTGGFATGGGLLQRLRALVAPQPTDNANVSVARYGDQYVALTEAPRALAFDPGTLETRGRFRFDDDLAPHLVSAHPVHDPGRGETVNLGVRFGRRHRYLLHRIPDGTTTREPIAELAVDRPAYVHSFGLTADHVVLAEFPLVVRLRRLLSPFGGSFVDSFEWEPERGTRFRLIDRDDGSVTADLEAPPCFGFHHVNAFERDGRAVVDLVAFDGPEVLDQLYLDRLQTGVPDLGGELRRYELPLDADAGARTEPAVLHEGITLPTFDRRRTGEPYRYAYGQGTATAEDHRLVAVDVEAGETVEFVERGAYFGEPVVVGRPGGEPGEGVVLSVGLDAATGESFLVALDAGTMAERARAPLPTGLPFDFHGRFFRGL